MGSVGNANPLGVRNSMSEWTEPKSKINEYGFEVEDSDEPDIEFTDRFWKKLADLKKEYGDIALNWNYELKRMVDNKIDDIVREYDDLYSYDFDLGILEDKVESSLNLTSDEYTAAYLDMADMLGLKPPRYTVLDGGMSAWDDTFSSPEQAEEWASNRDDAIYVFDTWTRKYRKIGGKNWRS